MKTNNLVVKFENIIVNHESRPVKLNPVYNIYIYIYSSNNNVINANCLSFNDPFLASKKDSQGVILRT